MSRAKDLRGFWKSENAWKYQELPLNRITLTKRFKFRDYRDKRPGITYSDDSITCFYHGDIPVWELEGKYRNFTEIEKVELDHCYSVGDAPPDSGA
jgi:hypothetical protein